MPNGRTKIVHYWAAEVTQQAQVETTFKPNDEIGALQWVPLKKARKLLSYERDMEVLDRFQQLIDVGALRTYPVIVLRHAKTLPFTDWDGPDSTRPLMQRGIDQAKVVASQLGAWGPQRIITSTATRCVNTVAPVASALGIVPEATAQISQDSHAEGKAGVAPLLRRELAHRTGVVLCSHGPVIPDIIAETAHQVGTPLSQELRRAVALGTGDYMIMHLAVNPRHKGIVGVEQYSTGI
jgi:8-oxo-dGTP diphosphatase